MNIRNTSRRWCFSAARQICWGAALLTAGWLHYLAFDLFVGSYIFSSVFGYLGGQTVVENFVKSLPLNTFSA